MGAHRLNGRKSIGLAALVGLAALIGFALGFAIGHFNTLDTGTGFDQLPAWLLGFLTAFIVGILLLRALAMRTGRPALAAGAMAGAVVIGSLLAPQGAGVWYGSGSAGTRTDPDAYWAGSVECAWAGWFGPSVQDVRFRDLVITDPSVLGAPLGTTTTINAIWLPGGWSDGYDFKERPRPDQAVVWAQGEPFQEHWLADVEDITADGSAGMATETHNGIVYRWSCSLRS